jgi:hypothetical protein
MHWTFAGAPRSCSTARSPSSTSSSIRGSSCSATPIRASWPRRRLLADPILHPTPVVILTADAEPASIERLLAIGARA